MNKIAACFSCHGRFSAVFPPVKWQTALEPLREDALIQSSRWDMFGDAELGGDAVLSLTVPVTNGELAIDFILQVDNPEVRAIRDGSHWGGYKDRNLIR